MIIRENRGNILVSFLMTPTPFIALDIFFLNIIIKNQFLVRINSWMVLKLAQQQKQALF